MKQVPLTQNKFAIVDDEDYASIMQYKWYFSRSSKNYGKAKSGYLKISMHQFIIQNVTADLVSGLEIDHINGNTLDNRRSNLRVVTHMQNQKNMNKHHDNKSGYKGVSWHRKAKKWQAHIMVRGKNKYLGLFVDVKKAAKVYNINAIQYFGTFAKLNDV